MNTKSWPPAPFARVSRAGLAEMVFERECSVESRGPDKYGRSIGRVSVDAADENAVKKKTTADHSDPRLKSDGGKNVAREAREAASKAAKDRPKTMVDHDNPPLKPEKVVDHSDPLPSNNRRSL